MGAYYQVPQQAQFLGVLWRSSCFRAFLLSCLENLRFDHLREIVHPGVPLILEDRATLSTLFQGWPSSR